MTTGGERLVLVGGGARSAAYRQVLASLAGRPVTVPVDDEIVTAGAALQAAVLPRFGSRDRRRLGLRRAVTDPARTATAAWLRRGRRGRG